MASRVAGAAVLWVVWGYNSLVAVRRRTQNAWAEMDVQLKRRHDLIPNLVATVKGIAAQEVTVFTAVANARANLMNARNPKDKIAANQQVKPRVAGFRSRSLQG